VRSEFIHLSRKVVIAQALIDLFHAVGADLPQAVYNKLKSLKTRSVAKEKEESLFRLQDNEIEQIRTLFANFHPADDQDLWDWSCDDYLRGKLAAEWNWVEDDFGINFLTYSSPSPSILKMNLTGTTSSTLLRKQVLVPLTR
jgi:hypothetical protein